MSSGVERLVVVDDEEIRLPRSLDPETTYDILLNDRHVWSLLPKRDTFSEDGVPVASWPPALRRYLSGRAEVVVRDHVTGELLATTRHVFGGDSTSEVTVTDPSGRSLVLDKWGRLTRPLSAEASGVIDELMDEVVRVMDVLRYKAGVPAYICYGTLLGAVRNGKLIGHDNDIDIAYVSEHPHPVDVVREGYRVERILRDEGWVVRRGSGVRLNVRLKLRDGSMRFVDVFTSHWVEGVLYIPSDTGYRTPRETILPLSTVELMGRRVPAPADPETLLAATYGESWRVPDPSFMYTTPRWLSRRLGGWFGGLMTHRKHWDSFNAKAPRLVPGAPTKFAHWVSTEYPSTRPLVDLGTGTGRDALWFAKRQHRDVIAVDYSVRAVNRGARRSRAEHLPVTFELLNLYDTRAALTLGARLSREEVPVDLYARFTLHALDTPGRENLFRVASMALRRGGLLFVEFRTHEDRGRPKAFGEHPRRYLRPNRVVAEIEAAGGRVVKRVQGTGLADLRTEDPHVCRIVASWC
jgi:SAM-dependent methyltransferase